MMNNMDSGSRNNVERVPTDRLADLYDVMLEAMGPNQGTVLSTVRHLTGLDIEEVWTLVLESTAPVPILTCIDNVSARSALAELEAAGATVQIVPFFTQTLRQVEVVTADEQLQIDKTVRVPYMSSSTEFPAEEFGRLTKDILEIHKHYAYARDSALEVCSEAIKRFESVKTQQTQSAKSTRGSALSHARNDEQVAIKAAANVRHSKQLVAGRLREEIAVKTEAAKRKLNTQGWTEYDTLFQPVRANSIFASKQLNDADIQITEARVRQIDNKFSVPARSSLPTPYPSMGIGCFLGAIIGAII
ncbi:MAG: ribosomal protein L7/L12, partial [Thermomicrobiales bacterium]